MFFVDSLGEVYPWEGIHVAQLLFGEGGMPGRRISQVLIDVVNALDEAEHPPVPDTVIGQIQAIAPDMSVESLKRWIKADVEDLPVEELWELVAILRLFVRQAVVNSEQFSDEARRTIQRYCTAPFILRTLTDRETLPRTARIDPVPILSRRRNAQRKKAQDEGERLFRSGHPGGAGRQSKPISQQLFGSRLVAYFMEMEAGHDLPAEFEDTANSLVAHDGDEFIWFCGGRPGDVGSLPMFLEGDVDPYVRVRRPFKIAQGEWFLYDGTAPHYWFAPTHTVALFVAASSGGAFRKAVAFRHSLRESVEASYTLESDKPVSQLLGKRLRRHRDAFGIASREVAEMKQGGGITPTQIGKIENNAIRRLPARSVASYAEAMDLPLHELCAWDPRTSQIGRDGYREEDRFDRGFDTPSAFEERKARRLDAELSDRPFAVVPIAVSMPPQPTTDITYTFFEGFADIVIAPVSGTVEVLIVIDPLLFVLELASRPGSYRASTVEHGRFTLSKRTFEAIREESPNLIRRDTVREGHVYIFNSAHPHCVVSGSNEKSAQFFAIALRNDVHVPENWLRATPGTRSKES
jgi:hypothetical protein